MQSPGYRHGSHYHEQSAVDKDREEKQRNDGKVGSGPNRSNSAPEPELQKEDDAHGQEQSGVK